MCLSAPKVITAMTPPSAAVPLRQPSVSPYGAGAAATATQDALRRRMGLASTILTSPLGAATTPATAGKTLLGA